MTDLGGNSGSHPTDQAPAGLGASRFDPGRERLSGAALGANNGRLMAAYDCYTLASNPHTKGTKAHAAFVKAFTGARQ